MRFAGYFWESTKSGILKSFLIRPVVYRSGKPARGGQADLPAEALAQAGDAASPALARLWRVVKDSA